MVHAQSDRVLYVQHILKGARRVETTPKPHLVSSYRIFCPRDMVPGKDLGIAKCFEKDGEEFIETKAQHNVAVALSLSALLCSAPYPQPEGGCFWLGHFRLSQPSL
jgi:hypothetical protein